MKGDTILFINDAPKTAIEAVGLIGRLSNKKLKVAMLRDVKQPKRDSLEGVNQLIVTDLNKPAKIIKALQEIDGNLMAAVCRSDKNVADFANVIPFVPYLRTPTSESVNWSVDKIAMRQRFTAYNKKITPKYVVVYDAKQESIKKIKDKVGFPLIIKPAGLGASLLVTLCYHEEELEESLRKIFRKINTLYKHDNRKEEPKVLVEEFMEGEMYSVDAYVSSRGRVTFCPFCHIKTGKSIGFDDFFGYQQMTPTLLRRSSLEEAEKVAREAIHALGLRSTSAHVEFIHTPKGFKIIEIGPRIGGFRHQMYEMSYGFNHSYNDIAIRIPAPLALPKKIKGYSVAMKLFARKEGRLKKVNGIKKIKTLKSFISIKQNKKVGERCQFAKNGGRSVANIIMFNKSRSELLADIRRVEKSLQIVTK